MVLAERLEVFPFLKIKPPPPLWLNRVKCSPFIHSHYFYHHSQCLRTKIMFLCGCGASRQFKSISIYKNKAPPLWLIWLSGVHLYIPIFYYHSQSLPVGVVLVERQEVFPFLKIKPSPPLWLNRVKCSLFIHSHCFYHHSQCLRTKI